MKIRCLWLLAACCWQTPLYAAPAQDPCAASAHPAERGVCQRYQAADQELNRIYKQVMSALAQDGQHALKQAQRAWIAFRDAECAAQKAGRADLAQQAWQECLAVLTQARAQSLQSDYAAKKSPQNGDDGPYQASDQKLNEVYQRVMVRLGENKQKTQSAALKIAQRAWITFRDAECAAQGAIYQGDIAQPGCLSALTETRRADLQRVYLSSGPAAPQNGDSDNLIGNWLNLATAYGMEIRFGVTGGVPHFQSFLNGIPYEAGRWQRRSGQLSLTDSRGKPLRVYQKIEIQGGVLYLYEQDGGLEKYQRQTASVQP